MQILTPEAVKKDSKKADEEVAGRSRGLAQEEERLIASINSLRKIETETKAEVEKSTDAYMAGKREERETIRKEVDTLYSQKKELLKPIDEIRREAEKRLAEAGEREKAVEGREDAATEVEGAHAGLLEDLHDKGQLLEEREEGLDDREERIEVLEAKNRASGTSLAEKWAEYHEVVHAKNAEMTERENAAAAGEKANAVRAEELGKREAEIAGARKELKSNYVALEQAKVHLGIK